jgi:hypothetical protein
MLYTIVVIWTGGQERARESNRQDSKQTGKGNTYYENQYRIS